MTFVGTALQTPFALVVLLLMLPCSSRTGCSANPRSRGSDRRRARHAELIPDALFLFFAVVIALLPRVLPSYHLDTGTRVGIYFIAILSLNLVLGFPGRSRSARVR